MVNHSLRVPQHSVLEVMIMVSLMIRDISHSAISMQGVVTPIYVLTAKTGHLVPVH